MGDKRSEAVQRISRHLLVGALSTAAAIASANATAAVDVFLKIGDVKGESKDSTHADSIDVLAWSWGKSEPVLPDSSQGRAVGKACISSFDIVKAVDLATPALFVAAASGVPIPSAKITTRKAGSNQVEFLVIEFKEVRVTSLTGGGKTSDATLTENVSFSFSSAQVTYTPINDGVVTGKSLSTTFNARSCD